MNVQQTRMMGPLSLLRGLSRWKKAALLTLVLAATTTWVYATNHTVPSIAITNGGSATVSLINSDSNIVTNAMTGPLTIGTNVDVFQSIAVDKTGQYIFITNKNFITNKTEIVVKSTSAQNNAVLDRFVLPQVFANSTHIEAMAVHPDGTFLYAMSNGFLYKVKIDLTAPATTPVFPPQSLSEYGNYTAGSYDHFYGTANAMKIKKLLDGSVVLVVSGGNSLFLFNVDARCVAVYAGFRTEVTLPNLTVGYKIDYKNQPCGENTTLLEQSIDFTDFALDPQADRIYITQVQNTIAQGDKLVLRPLDIVKEPNGVVVSDSKYVAFGLSMPPNGDIVVGDVSSDFGLDIPSTEFFDLNSITPPPISFTIYIANTPSSSIASPNGVIRAINISRTWVCTTNNTATACSYKENPVVEKYFSVCGFAAGGIAAIPGSNGAASQLVLTAPNGPPLLVRNPAALLTNLVAGAASDCVQTPNDAITQVTGFSAPLIQNPKIIGFNCAGCDANSSASTLGLKDLSISASVLNFCAQEANNGGPVTHIKSLSIKNTGSQDFQVSNVTFSSATSPFKFVGDSNLVCGGKIAPQASCELNVQYTPSSNTVTTGGAPQASDVLSINSPQVKDLSVALTCHPSTQDVAGNSPGTTIRRKGSTANEGAGALDILAMLTLLSLMLWRSRVQRS